LNAKPPRVRLLGRSHPGRCDGARAGSVHYTIPSNRLPTGVTTNSMARAPCQVNGLFGFASDQSTATVAADHGVCAVASRRMGPLSSDNPKPDSRECRNPDFARDIGPLGTRDKCCYTPPEVAVYRARFRDYRRSRAGSSAFSCFAHDLFDLGLRWIVRGSRYTGRAHGHEYDHQQDHQQAPEDEKPVPVNHVMQLQSVAPNPARRSRQLLAALLALSHSRRTPHRSRDIAASRPRGRGPRRRWLH
jgi:hypothetical protein